jgi:hypothetical protein
MGTGDCGSETALAAGEEGRLVAFSNRETSIVSLTSEGPIMDGHMNKLLSGHGFDILEAHEGPTAISVIRQFGGNITALVTDGCGSHPGH